MLAETLEGPGAAALSRHLPNVAAAVAKLQLTPAQQQAIAGHWRVLTALLAPVNKEISDLQQQIQELCQQDSGAFNCSSTSSGPVGEDDATSAASDPVGKDAAAGSVADAACYEAAAAASSGAAVVCDPAAITQTKAACAPVAAAAAAPERNCGASSSGACGLSAAVEGPERAEFIETQMQLADRLQVRHMFDRMLVWRAVFGW
jgi:hypothetical protein